MTQAADTQPGAYYVTVADLSDNTGIPRRFGRLLGPFINDHARALSLVDAARRKAEEVDPRACWYAFGTARYALEDAKPGVLNHFFNL